MIGYNPDGIAPPDLFLSEPDPTRHLRDTITHATRTSCTTKAELDDLPERTLVVNGRGQVWHAGRPHADGRFWWTIGNELPATAEDVLDGGPVAVVWMAPS